MALCLKAICKPFETQEQIVMFSNFVINEEFNSIPNFQMLYLFVCLFVNNLYFFSDAFPSQAHHVADELAARAHFRDPAAVSLAGGVRA